MIRVKLIPAALILCCLADAAVGYDGKLTITVADEATGSPLAARIELFNARQRPVRIKADGAVTRDGYTAFDAQLVLELPQGSYRFFLEAGPEYHTREGHFTIERHAEDTTAVTLKRHQNMAEHGWYAGDLDVRQRREDLPLLMRAAGISFAPELAGENLSGKCVKMQAPAAGLVGPRSWLDLRRGGGLIFIGRGDADSPGLALCDLSADASTLHELTAAHEAGTDAVALSADAWDLPLWIAADRLAAVQVLNRFTLTGAKPSSGSRPRDTAFFPGKLGSGRAQESVYYHLLNCGLRMPPAAGSASGSAPTPLGTNRSYVHCGDEFSAELWREGLRAGRVVVTNGPLLRTAVEGQPPGHVFYLEQGETHEFQIALSLSFYEKAPVEYLEIVKNGRVETTVKLDELARSSGQLPSLRFDGSGWFLVRAIASNADFYQCATTGPYYVESGYAPRISRASVEYFLKWLDELETVSTGNDAVLADITQARVFWEELHGRANAE